MNGVLILALYDFSAHLCLMVLKTFFYHASSNMLTLFYECLSIQGSFEAFTRQCGCCHGLIEDDERHEHLEVACDHATHYLCHPCALCQEGRELRRRVPHPGLNNGHPVFIMMPPTDQSMGRGI
jgi:hypothetical protein